MSEIENVISDVSTFYICKEKCKLHKKRLEDELCYLCYIRFTHQTPVLIVFNYVN